VTDPWILTGVLTISAILWCRARGSERAALTAYPPAAKARLYVPFLGWHDRISAADHVLLGAVRHRVNLTLPLLVLSLFATHLLLPPTATKVESPPARADRSTPPAPEMPLSVPVDTKAPVDIVPALPTSPTPSPEELAELRTSTRLYGSAKVKPVYRLYDVEGARITNIQANSFWALIGVQEGDTVIEIHGEPVDDPEALVSLMNIMAGDEHVAMAVRGIDGRVRYLDFRASESR